MTCTEVVAADRPVGGHHGWRIVAALAVSQTIGYGVLYYSYAVLLQPMTEALAASPAAVTGALTAAILAGAAAAVPVGRWLDRHGGRALMTTGSIAATTLVIAWSRVQNLAQLYAVMVGIGLCTAMVLYDPALAVVVSWFDERHRANAVLGVILVAGFASTIFFPLTAALVEHHGWRDALLVLGVVYGAVAVPLHALVVRKPPVGAGRPLRRPKNAAGSSVPPCMTSASGSSPGLRRPGRRDECDDRAPWSATSPPADTRPRSPPPSPACWACCRSPGASS